MAQADAAQAGDAGAVNWTGADPEVLAFDAADKRLDNRLSRVFFGAYGSVLFFPGDVTVRGDLVPAIEGLPLFAADPQLLIVAGDLTVAGRIALYGHLGLYVGGFTRAYTLEGRDPEIVIHDAALRYLLYGKYNDGMITAGDVEVPWLINSDHFLSVTSTSGYRVSTHRDDDDCDFNPSDLVDAFVPEVLDDYADEEEAEIEIEPFLARLAAGEPVLRPRARTTRERALDRIGAALNDGADELDLTDAQLDELPPELFAMPRLRSLVLDGNPLKALPQDLSGWRELEILSLAACGLTELPASLGELTRLRALDVSENRLATLPDVFDAVPLEELDISEREWPRPAFELPPSLAAAPLKRLIADRIDLAWHAEADLAVTHLSLRGGTLAHLTAVPEAVRRMPHLEELDLSGNYLRALPAWLADLRELETLLLHSSLAKVSGPPPNFSHLTALRELTWTGNCGRIDVTEPGHQVLRGLLAHALPALEHLDISRWGATGVRPALTAADLCGIGRFRNLRSLDLSHCDLSELPDELFGLAHLESLDLAYNDLPADVRRRVIDAFPAANVDLSDQAGPHADPGSQELEPLERDLAEADRHAEAGRHSQALAVFRRVVTELESGALTADYEHLYAWYRILIAEAALAAESTNPAKRAEHQRRAREAAVRCLDLAPTPDIVSPYTAMGQFHLEVNRRAGNAVAWSLVAGEVPRTDESLLDALVAINRAAACVDDVEHAYVLDTQARLLLLTGNEEDAWPVVRRAVGMGLGDVADLAADPRYITWSAS